MLRNIDLAVDLRDPMLESEIVALPQTVRAQFQALYPALSDRVGRFDPHIYLRANPDVGKAAWSTEDLLRHFCEHGHRECRLYAEGVRYTELYEEAFPHLRDQLRSFDPQEYQRANRDVGGPESTARDFFEHYCRHGATELRVRRDDGRVADRRQAIRLLAGVDSDCDLRVYAHLFFSDAAQALLPYLRNMSAMGAGIALSVSGLTFSAIEMERYAASISADKDAAFLTAPPEGRDWGGFYRLWQRHPPADDSVVYFLHSKKSHHMAPVIGEMWRNELLAPICGSYGTILATAEKLRAGYSMVAAALHKSRNVGLNRELVSELLPRLNLDLNIDEADFVAGSMFAIRGEVLNEFFRSLDGALNFSREGKEANAFDGSMAHACERLVGYFAASCGLGTAWVM